MFLLLSYNCSLLLLLLNNVVRNREMDIFVFGERKRRKSFFVDLFVLFSDFNRFIFSHNFKTEAFDPPFLFFFSALKNSHILC